MLCTCSNQFKFDERGGISKAELRLETSSRELSAKLKEGEVQLRQGSIHDAEVSLREALSINNEVPLFAGLGFACYVPSGEDSQISSAPELRAQGLSFLSV